MTPDELRQLFSELLEVDDLTTEDNFFDLGGSSVLALRLLLEVDKRWGVTLSLIDVLQQPDRRTAWPGAWPRRQPRTARSEDGHHLGAGARPRPNARRPRSPFAGRSIRAMPA